MIGGPEADEGRSVRRAEVRSVQDAELFPHALVYGADIDRDILFKENRIETF